MELGLPANLVTVYSWLVTYAKLHHFWDNDKYKYRAKEIVLHILIDCQNLRILRQKLQQEIEKAFGNMPLILGGKSQNNSSSIPNGILGVVLDFAEASQRFYSRML